MNIEALRDIVEYAVDTQHPRAKEAAKQLEAVERAATYAAYGRIPGDPAEQKHFMDTMLSIADGAK